MIFTSDQARELAMKRSFAAYMGEIFELLKKPAKSAVRVYCYCNLCGTNSLYGGFYMTKNSKAVMAPVYLTATCGLKPNKADELQATIVELLNGLRAAYLEFCGDIPGEIFIDFDLATGEPHCLVIKDKLNDLYDANLHYCSWAKAFGAIVPDLPPKDQSYSARFRRKFFGKSKKDEVVYEDPSVNAIELDMSWYLEARESVK